MNGLIKRYYVPIPLYFTKDVNEEIRDKVVWHIRNKKYGTAKGKGFHYVGSDTLNVTGYYTTYHIELPDESKYDLVQFYNREHLVRYGGENVLFSVKHTDIEWNIFEGWKEGRKWERER